MQITFENIDEKQENNAAVLCGKIRQIFKECEQGNTANARFLLSAAKALPLTETHLNDRVLAFVAFLNYASPSPEEKNLAVKLLGKTSELYRDTIPRIRLFAYIALKAEKRTHEEQRYSLAWQLNLHDAYKNDDMPLKKCLKMIWDVMRASRPDSLLRHYSSVLLQDMHKTATQKLAKMREERRAKDFLVLDAHRLRPTRKRSNSQLNLVRPSP